MKKLIETMFDIDTNVKEITIDNLTCYSIPRSSMKKIKENDDKLSNYGIYFLVNKDDYEIYIGQSSNVWKRISQHNNKNKNEFNNIYIFVDQHNSFNKSDIDYLEFYYINKIKKSQTLWNLTNKEPREKEPNMTNNQKFKIINQPIQLINFILKFLEINFDINKTNINNLENTKDESEISNEKDIFYFKDAKLIYESGDFFLLKDSIIFNEKYIEKNSSGINKDWEKWKNRQLNKGKDIFLEWLDKKWISFYDEDRYIVNKDIKINSPSLAGRFAKGSHSSSGWTVFKNSKGKTLDQVFRNK